MKKPIVFSGVQPTGDVHLGNYLGAFKRWAAEQEEKTNYFCAVDLHSLTVPQDPAELRFQTRSLTAWLLASGLDPAKCTLFVQSQVIAHAECCWLLNCVTPLGWLQRMTQYKTKAGQQSANVLTGLLDYPVLMAGDILLYDTNEVPVGEDQKQHVELTRDIAQRFNHMFGESFFVIPEPKIPVVAARVMGLDDPTRKMSKSFAHTPGHAIRLEDEDDVILKSIKRAKTDMYNEIRFSREADRAGVNNLLGIYQAITGKTQSQVEADFTDARGYGDLKTRVAEITIGEVAPIREKYRYLMKDIGELDRLLAIGAAEASAVASPKVSRMKEIMGLVVP